MINKLWDQNIDNDDQTTKYLNMMGINKTTLTQNEEEEIKKKTEKPKKKKNYINTAIVSILLTTALRATINDTARTNILHLFNKERKMDTKKMKKYIERIDETSISEISLANADTLALLFFGDWPATDFMIAYAHEHNNPAFIVNTILVAFIETGADRWTENQALIVNPERRKAKNQWHTNEHIKNNLKIPEFIRSEISFDVSAYQQHAETKDAAYEKYEKNLQTGILLLKENGITVDIEKLSSAQKGTISWYGFIKNASSVNLLEKMATTTDPKKLGQLLWTNIQNAFNDKNTDGTRHTKSYGAKVEKNLNLPIATYLGKSNQILKIDYKRIQDNQIANNITNIKDEAKEDIKKTKTIIKEVKEMF